MRTAVPVLGGVDLERYVVIPVAIQVLKTIEAAQPFVGG